MSRWQSIFDQIGEKMGNSFRTCEIQRDAIEQAGFVNVKEQRTKIPIGPWSKDKDLKIWGIWNRVYLLNGLEGFALRGLTSMLGVSASVRRNAPIIIDANRRPPLRAVVVRRNSVIFGSSKERTK